ncbi:MAG: carboxypeptidase regulatory-like domain-containing protein [Chloroflexaceae bacterium]|nr:carboxypeptidase regulatory-like domain-containing protein [Chloroflexaceae bacterium]
MDALMNRQTFEVALKWSSRISLFSGLVVFLNLIYQNLSKLEVIRTLEENALISLMVRVLDGLSGVALSLLIFSLIINFIVQKFVIEPGTGPRHFTINGIVTLADRRPVKDAKIYVDGIDSRRRTDINGIFRVRVQERGAWKITALYDGKEAHALVRRNHANEYVHLALPAFLLSQTDRRRNGLR